jgi:hypothetical protein
MSRHHPSLELLPTDSLPTDTWADDALAANVDTLLNVKSVVAKGSILQNFISAENFSDEFSC